METKALVYACSGCSSAGQMANGLALRLDREGLAEMSCIAGVGGGVAPLVKRAQAAERVIAIDGCPLHCALHSLRSKGVEATAHVDLSQWGVRKRPHEDFDSHETQALYAELKSRWLPTLVNAAQLGHSRRVPS